MRRDHALAAAVLLLAGACSCGASPRPRGGDASPATAPEAPVHQPLAASPTVPAQPAELSRAPTGTPPSDNLVEVAVDQRGSAALTLDRAGGLLFWRGLKQETPAEPVAIAGDLHNLDLRRHEDGWRAAGIDSSGAVHVLRLDDAGRSREIAATPPRPKALDVAVLGGKRVAVLGTDHSLKVLEGPRVVERYSARDFRPRWIRRHRDGTLSLVAMVSDDTETDVQVHRLRPSAKGLAATELAGTLPFASTANPRELRMSPRGRRLALFGLGKARKWEVAILELASGKVARYQLALAQNHNPGGGFVSEDRLALRDSQAVQILELDGESARPVLSLPAPAAHLQPSSLLAAGDGSLLAAGAGDHLFALQTKTKSLRYLGYRPLRHPQKALSATGSRLAWIAEFGRLAVMDVADGSIHTITRTFGSPQTLEFFGDDHLIVHYHPGHVMMYDVKSGAVVDSVAAQGTLQIRADLMRAGNQLLRLSGRGFESIGFVPAPLAARGLVKSDDGWRLLASEQTTAYGISPGQLEAAAPPEAIRELPASPFHSGALLGDRGRSYKHNPTAERIGDDGRSMRRYELPRPQKSRWLTVAPGGERVIVVSGQLDQPTRESSIYAFDTDTGERLWGRSGVVQNAIHWSEDGRRVLIGGSSDRGVVVLDAATGETLRPLCGYGFGARPIAPLRRLSNPAARPNMCSM